MANPHIKIVLSDKINTKLLLHEDYLSPFKRKIVYAPNTDKTWIPIGDEEGTTNLFLKTINKCFSSHFPLKLTPDLLWMLVIQGVAQHVKLSEKENRTLLVKHKGKKEIDIRKDELLYDNSKWAEIPLEIINKFRADLVDVTILDTLIPHYSTTTPIETTAFEIGVMDVFSSFFEYWVFSLCGIPEIYLEGNYDDWMKFKSNLEQLEQYGLDWWVKSLYPIIDKISAATLGEIDVNFWKSIYKLRQKSGGPFITGWIIKFFPYLKDLIHDKEFRSFFKKEDICHQEKSHEKNFLSVTGRNPFLFHDNVPEVLKIDKFHDGLSKVDFNWVTIDKVLKMQLVSGIMGMSQNPDNYALSPEIGWCVKEKM